MIPKKPEISKLTPEELEKGKADFIKGGDAHNKTPEYIEVEVQEGKSVITDTVTELRARIRKKEEKPIRLEIKLSKTLSDELTQFSRAQNRSKGDVIRRALREHFDKPKQ